MSVSYSDFKDRFPELASTDEAFFSQAKASALLSVNSTTWGVKADEGVKLMTAHIVTLSGRKGAAGAIVSEKVGDLQRSYAKTGDGSLQSTSYGQEFERIMHSLIVTPIMIF
tara:strand:- start:1639 stop:1974 length:336 start_codon:yes stop_codon:yes gene_type:complete